MKLADVKLGEEYAWANSTGKYTRVFHAKVVSIDGVDGQSVVGERRMQGDGWGRGPTIAFRGIAVLIVGKDGERGYPADRKVGDEFVTEARLLRQPWTKHLAAKEARRKRDEAADQERERGKATASRLAKALKALSMPPFEVNYYGATVRVRLDRGNAETLAHLLECVLEGAE